MFRDKPNIRADEDLTRIFEFRISRFGLLQATTYYDMFFNCFSKIALNPFLFPEAIRYKEGYRH